MLTNIVFPAEVNVQINKAKNKYIVFNILHNNVTRYFIQHSQDRTENDVGQTFEKLDYRTVSCVI